MTGVHFIAKDVPNFGLISVSELSDHDDELCIVIKPEALDVAKWALNTVGVAWSLCYTPLTFIAMAIVGGFCGQEIEMFVKERLNEFFAKNHHQHDNHDCLQRHAALLGLALVSGFLLPATAAAVMGERTGSAIRDIINGTGFSRPLKPDDGVDNL